MTKEENYCVYRHRRLDSNEIFYVGVGKNEKRAYDKSRRNTYWKNIVNKTDYSIEIVQKNLSKDNAKELEIFLIHLYGRKDLNTGNLCNMTDGGDGLRNFKYTEEFRKKLSNSSKGKKMSKEAKKKMSNYWKNCIYVNSCKIVLDTENGVFYNSLKEASEFYPFTYRCLIAMLSGQNRNKTNLIYV